MNPKKFTKEKAHKLNSDVRFPQVRVIGEGESVLMSSFDAAKLAESLGKDLILINELQTPPIVKIEDYNKFLYNLEKAEKEKKKNSVKTEVKEIQLSWDIQENDMKTKARKTLELLEIGNKVKCVIQLKNRQNKMPERGELVMLRFAEMVKELSVPEELPKLEGNKWLMVLKPIKKKKID